MDLSFLGSILDVARAFYTVISCRLHIFFCGLNAPVPIVWEGGIDYLYKDFMKPQTFAYAFAIFFHRSYSKKNQPSLCTQYVVDKVILFCASLVYMIQLLYQAIPVA